MGGCISSESCSDEEDAVSWLVDERFCFSSLFQFQETLDDPECRSKPL